MSDIELVRWFGRRRMNGFDKEEEFFFSYRFYERE